MFCIFGQNFAYHQMEKKLETKRAVFHIFNGNVVELEFKEDTHIDIEGAKEDFKAYWTFVNSYIDEKTQFLSLVTIPKNMDIDQEALKFYKEAFAQKEYKALKQAWVCPSYLSKVIAYVYNKMRKPAFPLKVFTNREKAIKWLEK